MYTVNYAKHFKYKFPTNLYLAGEYDSERTSAKQVTGPALLGLFLSAAALLTLPHNSFLILLFLTVEDFDNSPLSTIVLLTTRNSAVTCT